MDDLTLESVAVSAYHRWERRGRLHGHHAEDWAAASESTRFDRLYRVVAQSGPDGPRIETSPEGGGRRRRVCRFCERAEPRTRFGPPAPALAGPIAEAGPLAWDQCVECRSQSAEELDPALAAVYERQDDWWRAPDWFPLPIAAYKALIRSGLAMLPTDLLDEFPDALEWVENPDHDRDLATIAGLGGRAFLGPGASGPAWSAVARRRGDDAPVPSTLFYVSAGGITWQLPMPLGARDEDLEPASLENPPEISHPLDLSGISGPIRACPIALEVPKTRRRTVAPLAMAGAIASEATSFLSKLFS